MENFKTGDRLFFIDRAVQDVHACEIEYSRLDLATGELFFKIHDLTTVGHCFVGEKDIFKLEEDARSALYKERHDLLMHYQGELMDEKALIKFALNHVLCGEDCDTVARLAYELRAEELGLYQRN